MHRLFYEDLLTMDDTKKLTDLVRVQESASEGEVLGNDEAESEFDDGKPHPPYTHKFIACTLAGCKFTVYIPPKGVIPLDKNICPNCGLFVFDYSMSLSKHFWTRRA